jgi:hypothetical protein
MKKIFTLLTISSIVLFLWSCIEFQIINQPSVSLPNEIITVSITVSTSGGSYEPYFGVCLPIGWTIPGDSIQCSGAYNETIFYDSLVSFDQESVSPAPIGYYWWAGKGIPNDSAIGNVYSELNIQTDSQIGIFSIDYMLGDGYNWVNYKRSNGHIIQTTENPIITSVIPNLSYQNFTQDINIQGFITHFFDGLGTLDVWLSKNNNEIHANNFTANNNTSLITNLSIPETAPLGLWDVNVVTDFDGTITLADGFEILPPIPAIAVVPDSIYIELFPGTVRTKTVILSNNGWNDLLFNLLPVDLQKYAIKLDGVDDYVEIPDHPSLNVNNQITLEAWIKFESGGTYQPRIISKGPDGEGYELLLTDTSPECNLEFRIGPGSLISRSILHEDTWYHVASTYDGIKIKLYINGELDTLINASGNLNISNLNLFIGQKSTDAWDKYKGLLDEVRIWNVALSQSTIKSYMLNQLNGNEDGLVGYWQFNEGIGDITYDKTSNGNNGMLVGGVEWHLPAAPISPEWLTAYPDSGICYPDSSFEIIISFDAAELDTGNYYSEIVINSNDPFRSHIIIPTHMLISTTAGLQNETNTQVAFDLFQNYPNPFNPSTVISYQLPVSREVTLKVFDVLGNEVATLVNEEKPAGTYELTWYAANLPSGVYFYQLRAGSFVQTKKMLLLK